MLAALPSSTQGVAAPRRLAAAGHGGLLFAPSRGDQSVGQHCVAFRSDTEAVHYSVMASEPILAAAAPNDDDDDAELTAEPLPVLLRLGAIRYSDPVAQPCFVTAFDTRWDVLVTLNTVTRQLHAVHSFPPPGELDDGDDDNDELLTGGDVEMQPVVAVGGCFGSANATTSSQPLPPVIGWETNGVALTDAGRPVAVEALAASGGSTVAVVTSPGGLAAHRTLAVATLVAGESRRGDGQPTHPRLGVVTSGLLSVREAVGDVGPVSLTAEHGAQGSVSVVVVGALGGCLIARFASSDEALGGGEAGAIPPVYTAAMSRRVLSPELAGRPLGLHMSCASEATWAVWLPDDAAKTHGPPSATRSAPRSNVSPADLIAGRLFQPKLTASGGAGGSSSPTDDDADAQEEPSYGAGDGASRWNEIAAQTQRRRVDAIALPAAPTTTCSDASASSAAVADSLMLRRAAARMSLHLVTVMFADLSAAPVINDAKVAADVLHAAHAPGNVRATEAELTAIGVGAKGVVAVSTWSDTDGGAWACSVVDTASSALGHRALTLCSISDSDAATAAAVVLGIAVPTGSPIVLHGRDNGSGGSGHQRRSQNHCPRAASVHRADDASTKSGAADNGGGDEDDVPMDDGAALASRSDDAGGYVSQLRPLGCPPVVALRIQALRTVPQPVSAAASEPAAVPAVPAAVDTAALVAQMGELMSAQIARLEGVITQRFDVLERRLDRLESLRALPDEEADGAARNGVSAKEL